MAEKHWPTENDPNCYRLWSKDWRFWMTLFTIVITATIAWANLRNDVKINTETITVNSGRITTIEQSLPEIKASIGKIDTNIEWIKRNIK